MADIRTGPSLASIVRDRGEAMAVAWVSEVIQNANLLCGSSMDHKLVTMSAQMLLDRFKLRTTNALLMAVKDGMNNGKIYGKLTYPVLS